MKVDQDNFKKSTTRRTFIRDVALSAASFSIVPRHVLGGKGYIAPSDKVNVGIVGVGGRGKQNIGDLLKLEDVQITSIADPAAYWNLADFYYRSEAGTEPVKKMLEAHHQSAATKYPIKVYQDFRKMLDGESGIDAVLCATPDHTHAYVTLTSLRSGKHVYCEKPLTHNIWEARQVKKISRETGLATQMGNQLHSSKGIRKTVEYLKAGIIGEIREVHAWVPATRWSTGLLGLPRGSTPIPKGLDWDLWLGPRKKREFNAVYTPVTWRDFWDFGCGAMGDFGCHDLDAAAWGLNLPLPESVELFPAGYSDQNITPFGEIGYFHFPASPGKNPVKLTWYSGGLRPEHHAFLPEKTNYSARGALYIGEHGIMYYEGRGNPPKIYPESLTPSLENEVNSLPVTNGHHRDWIDAIKGGAEPSSNFQYGAHLTEITLLGVLSLRLGGKKIYWDSINMEATGIPEAEAFIREPVREGWEME